MERSNARHPTESAGANAARLGVGWGGGRDETHTQTRTPVASIRGSEDGDLCDARNKGRLFGSRDSCQERGPGLDPF